MPGRARYHLMSEVFSLGAARKLLTNVQSGGRIEVVDPALPEGCPVEITIRIPEDGEEPKKRSILEILEEQPSRRSFRTAEEVDEYLNAERDSWDR